MSITLNLFFIFLFGMIQISGHPKLIEFINLNALLQIVLFICVACIPFLKEPFAAQYGLSV